MLFEVRRAAAAVADALRVELAYEVAPEPPAPLQVVTQPRHEQADPPAETPSWS